MSSGDEKYAMTEQPSSFNANSPPPPQHGAVQASQWMPMPQSVPGCPSGLEYLTQIDQLLVHQQVELLEAITSFETKNRFVIKNSLGQQCYFAHEESGFCMRNCCGPGRGFFLHILDNANQEVLRLERPFKCCSGCCWCATGGHCSFNVLVQAPVGTIIGQVRQSQYFWIPHYEILDAAENKIFTIKGPCCICSGVCCTCDFPFEIYAGDTDGTPIGRISKQYSGALKELATDATNFSITFPMDLDVKMKATLLAATFLIDIMFFERNN